MKSLLHRRLMIPALLLATVACAIPRTTAHAKDARAASRLPKDVYLYISAPSVSELKKRFGQSKIGGLADDKSFAPFRKDIEAHLETASKEVQNVTGFSLEKLLAVPSGEASLAVVKGSGKLPGILWFVDFGSSKSVVDALLKLAQKTAKGEGAAVTTEKHAGTTITLITPAGNNAGEEGDIRMGPSQYAYCVKGTQLVFSTDIPVLKTVLTNWSGADSNSFAKSEAFSYIRKRCQTDGRDPAFEWYFNPLDLIQDIVRNTDEIPTAGKAALAFLPLLGITNFRAIGGSYDMATKEFDAVSKTVIYVNKPVTGLLNFFQFPAVNQAPPKWVAADASSYMAVNWDVKSAYSAFENLFNMVGAFGGLQALEVEVDKLAKDPNGPGIHIKKDLIDLLSGRIHIVSNPPAAAGDGVEIPDMIVSVGVKDEKKALALIAKLAADPNSPVTTRKVNGKTLYELDPGGLVGGNTGVMGLTIANGGLLFATDVKKLEAIMNGKLPAKTLASSPAYKRLAARFPAKSSMLSFQHSASQLKPVWDQIRGGAIPADIPGIDLTKLPPFSALAKYMSATASFTVPDEKGVYMESFSLKK